MTHHVRSLKNATQGETSWRELRSPPAANDIIDRLVPLSRSLPKRPEEIAALHSTLDLKEPSDLRAAAMLVMLQLGLRKHELVALDVSDVVLVGSVVCVSVKSRRRRDQGKPTFLPVIGGDAKILKAYVTRQHDESAGLTSPLFYNIEHGKTDRMWRSSVNAVSYWLLELRMRARQHLVANNGAPPVSSSKPKPGATRGARSALRHGQL
jgi:site-specific recombinase XerD